MVVSFCCFIFFVCFVFFKQKTAYEMRISDRSSDVCSSDLLVHHGGPRLSQPPLAAGAADVAADPCDGGVRREAAGFGPDHPPERPARRDRKSVVEGKSVSVRVDLGGRRISKKKQQRQNLTYKEQQRCIMNLDSNRAR